MRKPWPDPRVRRLRMEDKKKDFIAYLDDDNTKKEVWCSIIEFTSQYIIFNYNNEQITIPFHRILKVKSKEVEQ